MSGPVLYLSDESAASILSAAARAYPKECCGLIEGRDVKDGWVAVAVHETDNQAEDPSRHFLIDPQVQFNLLRDLRGTDRRIIGAFHSHPDGPPEPSATDLANAFEPDFLWLIAGGAPDGGFTLRAHLFSEQNGFSAISLREDG